MEAAESNSRTRPTKGRENPAFGHETFATCRLPGQQGPPKTDGATENPLRKAKWVAAENKHYNIEITGSRVN
jgi:hypothetical protein